MLTLCVFVFCLCLVCFESRRQPLRLVEVWDSLVLNQLRVFTGSLKEDLLGRSLNAALVFHMKNDPRFGGPES